MAINSFPIETTTVDISSIADNVELCEDYAEAAAMSSGYRTVLGITSDRTLALTDAGYIIENTGSSAITITIPDESTVGFDNGVLIAVMLVGTGSITVVADTGVTLNGVSGGSTGISTQWTGATLYKRGSDDWVIEGNLTGVVS